MDDEKFMVIWLKNERMGSFRLNQIHMNYFKRFFNMYLIQTDVTTGTQHWEVISIKSNAEYQKGELK
jgi:hypothetical protein